MWRDFGNKAAEGLGMTEPIASHESSGIPPPNSAKQPHRGDKILRLIGAFKLLKSTALIVASIATLRLMHRDIGELVIEWERRLHIAPGHRLIDELILKLTSVNHRQLAALAAVLAAYAVMYLVEGIGLLLLKRWAEWMTVLTTAGLIPIEIYENVHRPGWGKVLALVINVALAAYLVVRIRRDKREAHVTPS
jgi:uncharacterized membrane protein (DUF2068 family)